MAESAPALDVETSSTPTAVDDEFPSDRIPTRVHANISTDQQKAESSGRTRYKPYTRVPPEICPNFIEPPEIARLWREFPSYDGAHGAIGNRVVLEGPWGCGKRQIATYFAKEYAKTHDRIILWIEGFTHTTFIQDISHAYWLVTGTDHPEGVSVCWRLHRIQQALSQCPSKWFMVINDLNPYLAAGDSNHSGLELTAFLPHGQILITYAPNWDLNKLPIDLKVSPRPILFIEALSASVSVSPTTVAAFSTYCHQAYPSLQHPKTWPASTVGAFNSHWLTITVGCATARLIGISISDYAKSLLRRKRSALSRNRLEQKDLECDVLITFNCAMELFMEALRERNRLAETMLFTLSAVSYREVPLRFFRRLGCLRSEARQDYEDALALLQQASILNIRDSPDRNRCIDTNLLVFLWIRRVTRQLAKDGDPEVCEQIAQWIMVVECHMPETNHDLDPRAYWSMIHLLTVLFRTAESINLYLPELVSLLRKTATFMSLQLFLPGTANLFFQRAALICSTLLRHHPEFSRTFLQYQELSIARERANLHALLGHEALATQQIDYAHSCLESINLSEDQGEEFAALLWDDSIEQLLRQENFPKAVNMIIHVLETKKGTLSAERFAKFHYWMAFSAGDGVESVVRALQHSHRAVAYWASLPEEERWGDKSFSRVAWIDTHVDLLIQMDRSRLALVFLSKMFESYVLQCRPDHERVWRIVYYLVRENNAIWEVEEMERIACQALSLCSPNTLTGLALQWAILMLHYLGAFLVRVGRLVEGEAVLRWCLRRLNNTSTSKIYDQSRLPVSSLWFWLCQALLLQGKSREAKAARDLSLERGLAILQGDDWVKTAMEPFHVLRREYEQLLQLIRGSNDDEFNHIEDKNWFKTCKAAIEAFGDPFERVESGREDLDQDLWCTTGAAQIDSEILDSLGYCYASDSDTETGSADDEHGMEGSKHRWKIVFEKGLTNRGNGQTYLLKYWRPCDCRRGRLRSQSVDIELVLQQQRIIQQESLKDIEKSKIQKSILEYFPRIPKYDLSQCHENCPCIKANSDGKLETLQLESERLFAYHAPVSDAAESRQFQHEQAINEYRRKYGPRPCFPFGMEFIRRWRTEPRGSTESNGTFRKQSECLWTPDFACPGDPDQDFPGQEENAILNNPALFTGEFGIVNMPSISVTSYKLGEAVKELKCHSHLPIRPSAWTFITDYFEWQREETSNRSGEEVESNGSPKPISRTSLRIRRNLQRRKRLVQLKLRGTIDSDSSMSGSRSGVESRDRSLSSSRQRRMSASQMATTDLEPGDEPSHGSSGRGMLSQSKKLNVFSVASLHHRGPIFGLGNFDLKKTEELMRVSSLQPEPENRTGGSELNGGADEQDADDEGISLSRRKSKSWSTRDKNRSRSPAKDLSLRRARRNSVARRSKNSASRDKIHDQPTSNPDHNNQAKQSPFSGWKGEVTIGTNSDGDNILEPSLVPLPPSPNLTPTLDANFIDQGGDPHRLSSINDQDSISSLTMQDRIENRTETDSRPLMSLPDAGDGNQEQK